MMVIFDLDDTLLDHSGAVQAAILEFYRSHKVLQRISEEEFLYHWHKESERFYQLYLQGKYSFKDQRIYRVKSIFAMVGKEIDDERAWVYFSEYLKYYQNNWRCFSDVDGCLRSLQGRYRLGILSNGDGEQQRNKLNCMGLYGKFDLMVFSGDVGVAKPSPEIFQVLLKKAGLSPEQVVYVGDDLKTDILAAIEVGINGILIDRKGRYKETIEQMDEVNFKVTGSLERIPDIVDSFLRAER
ncbi:hypothetical protein BBF96_13610 [Anoxybacter fermentans]|uniref:HAD family hydrolase n=2 Tax=Anoxybacter fermentans TaxID=1323375 RepID=A0A3Q9HRV5_9FIRM|nr:hypothetical protein BBF96_13610 [Anoxybacter fermentans]